MVIGDGARRGRWRLLLIAAALSLPATAQGWNQYQTSQGQAMRWSPLGRDQTIPWSVAETDLAAAGLTIERLQQATHLAFSAWQQGPCDPCLSAPAAANCQRDCEVRPTSLTLRYLGARPAAGFGLKCTAWAGDGQCVEAEPNGNQVLVVHNQERWHYGSNVIAMTLVSALPADGWIADADIALNTAWYDFCSADCEPLQPVLEDTLLHEAGHFFGLDHSQHKTAAMWVHADVLGKPGLSLQPDDLQGICAIYGAAPVACEATPEEPADHGGSCTATRGPSRGIWQFGAAMAWFLWFRWRRRRSAGSRRAWRPESGQRRLGGVA